jgi:hypothetical protein
MSPTRELATQIHQEVTKLLKFSNFNVQVCAQISTSHLTWLTAYVQGSMHSPTLGRSFMFADNCTSLLLFGLQVVIGGTNMNSEISRLKARVPDILVATPGNPSYDPTYGWFKYCALSVSCQLLRCQRPLVKHSVYHSPLQGAALTT